MTQGKHTPGPWEVQTPMGDGAPWIVQSGKQAYEWEAIAALGDCLEDLNPRSVAARTIAANAARIVSCVNACEGIADPSAIKDVVEAAKRHLEAYEAKSNWDDRDATKAFDRMLAECELADEDLRAALAKLGVRS